MLNNFVKKKQVCNKFSLLPLSSFTIVPFVEYTYSLSSVEVKELLGIPLGRLNELVQMYTEHCQRQSGRPPKLSPKAEILLITIFLRHHLVDVFLGALFQIQAGTARHIRHRLLSFLYENLKNRLSLGTSELRKERGVKALGSMVTYVLDGSEQPVQSSNNPVYDSLFYSTKKKATQHQHPLGYGPKRQGAIPVSVFPGSSIR